MTDKPFFRFYPNAYEEMGGEVGESYALIFKTLKGEAYVAMLDLD